MRTPLPHISASLPSGLKMRSAKRSAARRGADQQDAVGADAEVAVAQQAHALRGELEGDLVVVEDDVLVPQTLPVGELHLAGTLPVWLHGRILLFV